MSTVEEMMEYLWQRRVKNLPAAGLAEVFDRLIWCMDDNGGDLLRVREKWLLGDDIDKVRVALAMEEVFPRSTRHVIITLCERLMTRWPELRPECESLIRQWDEQHKD